jgi:hypothetical protein
MEKGEWSLKIWGKGFRTDPEETWKRSRRVEGKPGK